MFIRLWASSVSALIRVTLRLLLAAAPSSYPALLICQGSEEPMPRGMNAAFINAQVIAECFFYGIRSGLRQAEGGFICNISCRRADKEERDGFVFRQVICDGTNGFQSGFRVTVGCFVSNEFHLAFFQSNRFVECVGFFCICLFQNIRIKYNRRIRRNIYNTD